MSSVAERPVIASQPSEPDAAATVRRRRVHRRLALVLAVQGVILASYWIAWMLDRSLVAADTSPEYDAFEAAFPLPDSFIVITLLLAARDLWADRPRAVVFILLGSGAGMFLGLVDVAYDLQNGIWTNGVNGVVELVAVVAILGSSTGFGLWGCRTVRRLGSGHQW